MKLAGLEAGGRGCRNGPGWPDAGHSITSSAAGDEADRDLSICHILCHLLETLWDQPSRQCRDAAGRSSAADGAASAGGHSDHAGAGHGWQGSGRFPGCGPHHLVVFAGLVVVLCVLSRHLQDSLVISTT